MTWFCFYKHQWLRGLHSPLWNKQQSLFTRIMSYERHYEVVVVAGNTRGISFRKVVCEDEIPSSICCFN